MRILVTGAHGFLARGLLALPVPVEWVACGRGTEPVAGHPYHQVDLNDADQVDRVLDGVRPDWVINTAAQTSVDQCETDPEAARRVNVMAVEHLARACARVGSGLLQLSTDYVFDGAAGPYAEGDPPHPLSHYGRMKLESERVVLEGLQRAMVVRTLWLYGYVPGGKPNFVTWALQVLHRGERLTVFDDQWGNPTYVGDLAHVLAELCRADARGLFHVGGATFLTRHELALALCRHYALDEGLVTPVPTRDAGLVAARPLRSGLRTAALETFLSRRPLGFVEGLEDMGRQPAFRRDFAHLLQG
ncbi:MAG: dTDP-4-dehydrorhamnose reductase [Candidatus Latescibacterota bacterium]